MSKKCGRLDTMPLDVLADIYSYIEEIDKTKLLRRFSPDMMLRMMYNFMESGNTHFIYYQIYSFIREYYNASVEDAILDVSNLYITEMEFDKRIPVQDDSDVFPCHCHIDAAISNCLSFLSNTTESKDEGTCYKRLYLLNLIELLWTIKHKPHMNDLPYTKNVNKSKVIAKTSKNQHSEKPYSAIIEGISSVHRPKASTEASRVTVSASNADSTHKKYSFNIH